MLGNAAGILGIIWNMVPLFVYVRKNKIKDYDRNNKTKYKFINIALENAENIKCNLKKKDYLCPLFG